MTLQAKREYLYRYYLQYPYIELSDAKDLLLLHSDPIDVTDELILDWLNSFQKNLK